MCPICGTKIRTVDTTYRYHYRYSIYEIFGADSQVFSDYGTYGTNIFSVVV